MPSVLRLLVGVLLLPLAAALGWSAAKALAGIAMHSSSAGPFVAGLALTTVAWLVSGHVSDPAGPLGWMARLSRWAYVAGHEVTHALAAWGTGGSVFAIKVEEKGGHVDVSRPSVFVALAPYCVPLYVLLVIVGYRVLLWLKPDAQADVLFLLLMGAALAFHALMTYQTLTEIEQPDLKAAGGKVFSMAVIVGVNGLIVLTLLKALFPEAVVLGARLRESGMVAYWFWTGAWKTVWPILGGWTKKAHP